MIDVEAILEWNEPKESYTPAIAMDLLLRAKEFDMEAKQSKANLSVKVP